MQTFAFWCVFVAFQHCANTVANCIDKSSWGKKCFFNKASTNKTWTMSVSFYPLLSIQFLVHQNRNVDTQSLQSCVWFQMCMSIHLHVCVFVCACDCATHLFTINTNASIRWSLFPVETIHLISVWRIADKRQRQQIEFSHMINSQQISDAHVCNVSMKRISHRYSSLLHLRNANTNTRKPPSENDSCRQPVT